MSTFIDLTGQRFGHLQVISRAPNASHGQVRWHCVCDCGEKTISWTNSLRGGRAKSCGCEGRKHAVAAITKHGETNTKLHHIWETMRKRCRGLDAHHKKYYKDRGITVCDAWNDYVTFRDWALNNGYKEGLEIDRIDNDKGYFPENCRWVTRERNIRNRSNTVMVTYKGETKSLVDFAEEYGVNYKLAWERHKKGMPMEKVLYKGNLGFLAEEDIKALHLEDLPF